MTLTCKLFILCSAPHRSSGGASKPTVPTIEVSDPEKQHQPPATPKQASPLTSPGAGKCFRTLYCHAQIDARRKALSFAVSFCTGPRLSVATNQMYITRSAKLVFYRAAWITDAVLQWEFCPSVRSSVRPSVKRVDCDKVEERYV